MVSVFAWVIYAIGTCAIGRPFTIAFDDVHAEFTTLKGVFKKEMTVFIH